MTSLPAGGPAPHGAGPRPLYVRDITHPSGECPLHGTEGVHVWPPLPWRTRLRLAIHRALTGLGCWLGDHVSWDATERLWRATGLLRRR